MNLIKDLIVYAVKVTVALQVDYLKKCFISIIVCLHTFYLSFGREKMNKSVRVEIRKINMILTNIRTFSIQFANKRLSPHI